MTSLPYVYGNLQAQWWQILESRMYIGDRPIRDWINNLGRTVDGPEMAPPGR